jgi:hypothetical protein
VARHLLIANFETAAADLCLRNRLILHSVASALLSAISRAGSDEQALLISTHVRAIAFGDVPMVPCRDGGR